MRGIFPLLSLLFCSFVLTYSQEVEPPIIAKSLKVGAVYENEDYSIQFVRVLSDSRCPKNVDCVWPGGVEVELEVYNALFEESKTHQISVDHPEVNDKLIVQINENINLYFHNLKPYPQNSNMEITKDEYYLVFYEKIDLD